jgi:ABC-type glycerol-3-phosphate transport system substrate-binding protein
MWWWGQQNYDGQGKVLDALLAEYSKTDGRPSVKHVLQGTDETIPAYETAAQAKKGPDIATLWYGAYMFPAVWKGSVEPLTGLVPRARPTTGSTPSTASTTTSSTPAGSAVTAPRSLQQGPLPKGGPGPGRPADHLGRPDHQRQGPAHGRLHTLRRRRQGRLVRCRVHELRRPPARGWLAGRLLIDAVSGETSWTDPQLADQWERLAELRDARAFNENVTSLDYFEGRQEFSSNTATMTFSGSIPAALQAVRKLGPDKAGIMAAPDLEDSRGGFLPGMPLTQFVTPFSATSRHPRTCSPGCTAPTPSRRCTSCRTGS